MQVNRNGKIAMKPDEGDGIVGVQMCSEEDDILLTTANGQCVRFRSDGRARVLGPHFTGNRGINLADGDSVIGMAVLRTSMSRPRKCATYFKWDAQSRGDVEVELDEAGEDAGDATRRLPFERLAWLKTQEQFILTVTSGGLGKRASSYEYRVTGRGGKGLIAHKLTGEARIVASFPVQGRGGIAAGHRQGPAHPHRDRSNPHRRPRDPGRDPDQCRAKTSTWSRPSASRRWRRAASGGG